MGRYYWNKKTTVEEAYDLTIFQLKEMGLLADNASKCITWVNSRSGNITSVWITVTVTGEPHIRLEYSVMRGGNETEHDSTVFLTSTPCNYGGIRFWFMCPVCLKRVGGIYRVPGGFYFACRRCCDLSYHSRNACCITAMGVAERQAKKLRGELKRWTYNGSPTRKYRRVLRLERKVGAFARIAMSNLRRMQGRMG